ncbi:MAG: ADP-ribosylation factor-like protein [Candidatus Hodarchaeales archaeon]
MLPVYAKKSYSLFSIAFTGLSNSGKTSILKKMLTGTHNEEDQCSTVGVNVELVYQDLNNHEVTFRFFDMSGMISFRSLLWPQYLSISQAVVYVVDLADSSRLPVAIEVFKNTLSYIREDIKILFLGNKQDLLPNSSLDDIIEEYQLNDLVLDNQRTINFYITSVKTGYNLKNAFKWLTGGIWSL